MRLPSQNRRFLKRTSLLNFCFRKPQFSEGIPSEGKGKEMVSFRGKSLQRNLPLLRKIEKNDRWRKNPPGLKRSLKFQEIEWEPNHFLTILREIAEYEEEWPSHMLNLERLILSSRDPGLYTDFHVQVQYGFNRHLLPRDHLGLQGQPIISDQCRLKT